MRTYLTCTFPEDTHQQSTHITQNVKATGTFITQIPFTDIHDIHHTCISKVYGLSIVRNNTTCMVVSNS